MSNRGRNPNNDPINIPRFQAELARFSHSEVDLPPDTHKRYKRGKVPSTFVRLLQRYPNLARALCDDLIGDQRDAA